MRGAAAAAKDYVLEALLAGLEPEPALTVSEWADEYREMSGRGSSQPGRWRTDRTPYLRDIMDALSPSHPARRVVFMKGTQIGATEAGNNWIGYSIHRNPGPVLMVQPTGDNAKKISKQRIAPMIETTPVLRERVLPSRSRDSGNTLLVKEFTNGILIMTGANSAAGLRSLPMRDLMADELDEWPGEVGEKGKEQGDPLSIAEERLSTFGRQSKTYLVSTPTVKGTSRIEAEFLASDQRRYFVPCPFCGHMDWLQWRIGGWSGRDGKHHHIYFEERKPETACLVCSGCDQKIPERYKTQLLARGEWKPTAVGEAGTIGFHLSSLYSPLGWRSWEDCVRRFLRAKKEGPLKLKAWVNLVLGETWDDDKDRPVEGELLARRESYGAVVVPGTEEPQAIEVPHGVGVLVCSVDTQGDRLEAKVIGYGAEEESWLVAYDVIQGDPGQRGVWSDLTRFRRLKFRHASGREVPISITVIDSGGNHTQEVYRYASLFSHELVFAIRGGNAPGTPLIAPPSDRNRYRIRVYTLGVSAGKDTVYSRAKIQRPGPGYMHLPAWVTEEYIQGLLSEKAVPKYVKGRGVVRTYEKLPGIERNEPLDLEVYGLAGYHILGAPVIRTIVERAAELSKAPPPAAAAPKPPAARAPRGRRRGAGYVDRWRE